MLEGNFRKAKVWGNQERWTPPGNLRPKSERGCGGGNVSETEGKEKAQESGGSGGCLGQCTPHIQAAPLETLQSSIWPQHLNIPLPALISCHVLHWPVPLEATCSCQLLGTKGRTAVQNGSGGTWRPDHGYKWNISPHVHVMGPVIQG